MPRAELQPLLYLALLVLPLLPGTVIALPASVELERVELNTFVGLKSLFHRLRREIEAHFEDPAIARKVLGSSLAYREFSSALSGKQQQHLKLAVAQCVGHWQQFRSVALQVLGGDDPQTSLTYAQAYAIFIDGESARVSLRQGAMERDRFVERMHMLGYTPQEVADVISGRITLSALKRAGRMRSLGYPREKIAAYLECHYQPVYTAMTMSTPAVHPPAQSALRDKFDRLVLRYARDYNIDPEVIRAIISNESSWRPQVRSPAGAIGLMQLMPATAEMLGVNPLDPEQNIEGGTRYLAALLQMFDGDMEAALVGYNAGPHHARKWRTGSAVLYGETRNYLERIKFATAR